MNDPARFPLRLRTPPDTLLYATASETGPSATRHPKKGTISKAMRKLG